MKDVAITTSFIGVCCSFYRFIFETLSFLTIRLSSKKIFPVMFKQSPLLKATVLFFLFLTIQVALGTESSHQEISSKLIPELVLVADPGNAPDASGHGAVSESFFLSKYPITVDQWAFFMNCVYVDPANQHDLRGLYHSEMCTDDNEYASLQVTCYEEKDNASKRSATYCARSLNSNFFSEKIRNRGTFPITNITMDDAKRYCNWCEHGCPQASTLEEALAVTENGAYDFTGGKKGDPIVGAVYSLPTAELLYKAMYYKGGSTSAGYWDYPTKSNAMPTDSSWDFYQQKRKGANVAVEKYNWLWKSYTAYFTGEEPYLTPVGFFDGSAGPYGHYDLGGNVRVWSSNSMMNEEGTAYLALGGSWKESEEALKRATAFKELFFSGCYPTIGMRLAASNNQTQIANFSHSFSGEQVGPIAKEIIPAASQNSVYSFFESLWNVTCSQIITNLIEIAMNACSLETHPTLESLEEGGEALLSWISSKLLPWAWEYRIESLKPFTWPRIGMNCVFSLITAAGINMEVTPYLKDDSWESISWTIAKTVLVMASVESGAFLLEYPTAFLWYYFSGAEEVMAVTEAISKGITMVAGGLTWNRLLLNVLYIALNTYLSVGSTLQDYHQQHPALTR